MKIHSYQQGGLTPPFVSWTPVPDTPVVPAAAKAEESAGAASGSGSGDGEGLLSKEMLKLLMENGLPSDVQAFSKSVAALYEDPVYRATGQLDPDAMGSAYMGIISQISRIKYDKDLYDEQLSNLASNGGIADMALTATGRMIVRDVKDGSMTQVTPDEYHKRQGEYRAVTNGDLAHLRAVNPSLAFNNDIFDILNNGIGPETIQKRINAVMEGLQSSSVKTSGYVTKKGKQVIDGLRQLETNPAVHAALASNGTYKVTKEEEGNVEQAEAALEYIYAMMPDNEKAYMRAKAAVNGMDPDEGAKKIMLDIISPRVKSRRSLDVDYDASASKAAGLDDGTGSSTVRVRQDRMAWDGFNAPENVRTYRMNPGTEWEFDTPAMVFPAIEKLDGKGVAGQESISKLLEDSTLSTGYKENMWFGGRKVDPHETDRMLYTGGNLVCSYLPVTDGGGPDVEAAKKIQQAEKQIEAKGGSKVVPKAEQREIYRRNGVERYYGIRENPGMLAANGLVKPFYMVDAMAADGDGVSFGKGNPYVKEHEKDYDTMNEYMNRMLGGEDIVSDGWWITGLGSDDIFSGTFFIEASDPHTSAGFMEGIQMPKSMSGIEKIADDDARRNIKHGNIR